MFEIQILCINNFYVYATMQRIYLHDHELQPRYNGNPPKYEQHGTTSCTS